jgi:hypothetical protein
MTDANDRLHQFLVMHERCGGARVDPLSEADLTESGCWATIRCPGCGSTIREELDGATAIAQLAGYVGMEPEEFVRLSFEAGGWEQLERRLQESPRVTPDVLARILRARRSVGEQLDN